MFNTVGESDEVEMEKGGNSPSSNSFSGSRYQADWEAAFVAIHGLVTSLIILIFLLGYLLIN